MMVGRRLIRGIFGLTMCLVLVSCNSVDQGAPVVLGPAISDGVGGSINSDVTGGVGRIAYIRPSPGSGSFHIYVIQPDGTSEVSVNEDTDLATYSGTSWSPDGTQIAFNSDRSGNANHNIYVMNLDGSNLRAVVEDSGGDFAPAWSPDGQKILFQAWRDDTTRWDIYIVDIDGSNEQRLIGTELDEQLPSWSPDGSKILYQAGREDIGTDIYLANADGSGVARVTSGNGRVHSSPAWSPDGSQIAFESNLHQAVIQGVVPVAEFELYVMNADGSNVKRMTFEGTSNSQVRRPTWSPDGSQIAFEFTTVFSNNSAPFTTLVVLRVDGTNLYGVPNMPNGGIFPKWSPVP
jgi:TolB protein